MLAKKEFQDVTPLVPQQGQFQHIQACNGMIVDAFQQAISTIKDHLTGNYMFLLTDADGILLAMDQSYSLTDLVNNTPIQLGMSFASDSCGVNAISETMRVRGPVYLPPEEHENPLFHSWHCFATPLMLDDRVVGYLDVSTIAADMQSELIAIAKLIPAQMLNYSLSPLADYNQVDQNRMGQADCMLTERQLKVLKLIAQGEKVKSIAMKLQIKECTVNHHKRIIFNKLGVQSSAEAVSIASRMSYL